MLIGLIVIAFGIFIGLNELGRELAKGSIEAAKVKARARLIEAGRGYETHKL